MKRLIFVSLLFAAPALAQQAPTPEQYIGSLQVTVSDSLTQIKTALAQRDQEIASLTKQVADDKKQIADLTKERDELKTPATQPPAAH